MKILMATMSLGIGGAETHIVELSRALISRGHEVVLVSHGGVYVAEAVSAGAVHYDAPLHRRSLRDMKESYRILRQVIEKERPDVVHAHARIPAMLCGMLSKKLRFPFVTSAHGVYDVSAVLRRLSNWGERTLAVSEDVYDYLIREYGVQKDHITLTINGIDTEKFTPEVSGETVRREFSLGDAPVLCHVSRLDDSPALIARNLIHIAPRLNEAFPSLKILIAGGGDALTELNDKARFMNEQLGREMLVLTGPRVDIPNIIAAGDLFLGVSRAALEAMSAEKATVLSGAQGHMGLFTPEKLDRAIDTNFCCRTDPVATSEELCAELIRALKLTREERDELGKYGRRIVGKHYSTSRMAEDAISVYERVKKRKYNVVMSGYYGFSNAGDDAILDAIRTSLDSVTDDVGITVLSKSPELTRRQYGLRAVPRFDVFKVRKALGRCDCLISGGGSLLQDTTSTRSLIYYTSVIKAAKKMGKKVMLYANGIGPISRPQNRRRAAGAVRLADVVTLRDHGSLCELAAMGADVKNARVTADPVFTLPPSSKTRAWELLRDAGIEEGCDFAVISVRNWRDTDEFCRRLADVADHIIKKHGMEVLFVLMQPENDRGATEKVRSAMTCGSKILSEDVTPRELTAVLGEAKLCLAMRLHTLIFAARMATPTLGLAYDPKVENFLHELGQPSAGHVHSFNADKAIAAVDELMANYDSEREKLEKCSKELGEKAMENVEILLQLVKERGE